MLQNQVVKMRETYQSTLCKPNVLSQLKSFTINEKFELNRDDASYMLSFETDVPIDNVLLQCDVPIDLLDSEKNTCVLSYSECDENDGNFLLATYRLNFSYLSSFFKIISDNIHISYKIPSKHHTVRYKDKNNRRPIWNASGLRYFTNST